jgi:hypothetical protein
MEGEASPCGRAKVPAYPLCGGHPRSAPGTAKWCKSFLADEWAATKRDCWLFNLIWKTEDV